MMMPILVVECSFLKFQIPSNTKVYLESVHLPPSQLPKNIGGPQIICSLIEQNRLNYTKNNNITFITRFMTIQENNTHLTCHFKGVTTKKIIQCDNVV